MVITFTASVMDLLHKGHKDLLKMMNDSSDKVVVFLHDDYSTYLNKGKFPVQSYKHRKANLLKTGLVDKIIKVRDINPQQHFLKFINKNSKNRLIYIRGNDWLDFPGKEILTINNIDIYYKQYTKGISSSKIRDEINKR